MHNLYIRTFSPEVNPEDLRRVTKLLDLFEEIGGTIRVVDPAFVFDDQDLMGRSALDVNMESNGQHSYLSVFHRRADGVLFGTFDSRDRVQPLGRLLIDPDFPEEPIEDNAAALRVTGNICELEVHYLELGVPPGNSSEDDLWNPDIYFKT